MGPCDVALPDGSKCDDKIFTVVQPDIMVICDPKKIEERGIIGSPDLEVEIIAPETVRKDSIIKRHCMNGMVSKNSGWFTRSNA